jgi:hypothetical protein
MGGNCDGGAARIPSTSEHDSLLRPSNREGTMKSRFRASHTGAWQLGVWRSGAWIGAALSIGAFLVAPEARAAEIKLL